MSLQPGSIKGHLPRCTRITRIRVSCRAWPNGSDGTRWSTPTDGGACAERPPNGSRGCTDAGALMPHADANRSTCCESFGMPTAAFVHHSPGLALQTGQPTVIASAFIRSRGL